MDKAEKVFIKIAEGETYPLSRGYMTLSNIEGLSIPGRIFRRAAQGRKNIGQEGLTGSEKKLISKMKKDDSGTHPITRAMTSVPVGAALGGVAYGVQAPWLAKMTYPHLSKGKLGLIAAGGAALGAGVAGASTLLGRHIYSRAMLGRAEKDRKGWTKGDKELLKQLKGKEKKAEYVYLTMEKDAQAGAFFKGLWGAGKSVAKGYGKNVAKDWKALKGSYKGMSNIGKNVKGKGFMTAGQERGLQLLGKKRNQALVGLAGRVGLPGAIGYNILTD